jgi:hypothetical protein
VTSSQCFFSMILAVSSLEEQPHIYSCGAAVSISGRLALLPLAPAGSER